MFSIVEMRWSSACIFNHTDASKRHAFGVNAILYFQSYMDVDTTTVVETGRSDATKANVAWDATKRQLTFSVSFHICTKIEHQNQIATIVTFYSKGKGINVLSCFTKRIILYHKVQLNYCYKIFSFSQYDHAIVFSDDITICFNATIDKDNRLATGSRLVHATVLMDMLWSRAEFGHANYPMGNWRKSQSGHFNGWI